MADCGHNLSIGVQVSNHDNEAGVVTGSIEGSGHGYTLDIQLYKNILAPLRKVCNTFYVIITSLFPSTITYGSEVL